MVGDGSHSLGGSSASEDQLVGRILGGKLRLDAKLGAGASGAVYRAHHLALDKSVAIKVLHASHTGDPNLARRFAAEARAAARFDHPNSVQILDFGEEGEDGLLYIAMELLDGEDLQAVLNREQVLPSGRVAAIMGQAASALALAHEQGIVHRDLKPSNIMLVPDVDDDGRPVERVKVCDFGLAKILDAKVEEDGNGPLTKAGVIFGTPAYMAPEQAQGEPVDHRADVYAVGVIMFRMVTGRPLFSGDTTTAILMKHILDAPPSTLSVAPSCHPRLAALIDDCVRKPPEARPPSMREVLSVLREIAYGEDTRTGSWPNNRHGSFARRPTEAQVQPSSPDLSVAPDVSVAPLRGVSWPINDPASDLPDQQTRLTPSSLEAMAPPPASRANLAGLVLGSVALVLVGGLFAYVVLKDSGGPEVVVEVPSKYAPPARTAPPPPPAEPEVAAVVQAPPPSEPAPQRSPPDVEASGPPDPEPRARPARAQRRRAKKPARRRSAVRQKAPEAAPPAREPPPPPEPTEAPPPERTEQPSTSEDAVSPEVPSEPPPPPPSAPPEPPPPPAPPAPARLQTGFAVDLRLADVDVSGGLSVRKISGALRRTLGQTDECMRRALEDGGVETKGKIGVRGTIGFSGKLEQLETDGDHPALHACVKEGFLRGRMPRPDTGQARVTFSVLFRARN